MGSELLSVTPGSAIAPTTTIDQLVQALFTTRSANLSGAPSYQWSDVGVLQGSWSGQYPTLVTARFEARPIAPDILSLPSVAAVGDANAAQVSIYDDFVNTNLWTTSQAIGAFPGFWTSTGGMGSVTPTSAKNGVLSISPGNALQANIYKTATQWPLPYSNITKIVARFVFALTSVGFPAGQEATLGFTHTGTMFADGSNNLYGAYINFCPGYSGLPDWTTRVNLSPAQTAGFTYGVYGGQAVSGFGYKGSSVISTTPGANTWYEGIISMIPGVNCGFYIAPYGSTPVLDQICTVTALIPNLSTAGPVVTMAMSPTAPGLLEIDKCQYAIWTTEGNKQLTDSQLYVL